MIALTAITIDRNVASSRPNASRRTKPKTSGIAFTCDSLKSFEFAVSPVTAYSTPSTCPSVCGSSVLRKVASAAFEASSVPFPSSGISTLATVPSGLVVTSIGAFI